jgi:hypothetical protein
MPKALVAMGMNVQRGVMLAGYGIFPSAYLSLFHNFKTPLAHEDRLNGSSKEATLYLYMKYATWLVLGLCVLMLLLF